MEKLRAQYNPHPPLSHSLQNEYTALQKKSANKQMSLTSARRSDLANISSRLSFLLLQQLYQTETVYYELASYHSSVVFRTHHRAVDTDYQKQENDRLSLMFQNKPTNQMEDTTTIIRFVKTFSSSSTAAARYFYLPTTSTSVRLLPSSRTTVSLSPRFPLQFHQGTDIHPFPPPSP